MMTINETPIINIIVKGDICYIQSKLFEGYGNNHCKYLINGEPLKETFKPKWFETSYPILKIQKNGDDKYENYRYYRRV